MRCKFPKNTPKFVRKVLSETLSFVHFVLQDNLVGIYLYGSLAMECFNPKSSDIDIIVIARKRLSKEQRKKIIEYLKGACSKNRRIEFSVLCKDVVQDPQYPILVDLHFEWWGGIFEDEKDNEILSNLYTTKKRGFCVWGMPRSNVFSGIPAEYHLRSVIEDITHTRKYLHENPERVGYDPAVYWILGSCRILAFMREEKVLSKLEGGQWGLTNLPKQHHEMVKQALSYYQGKKKKRTWNHQKLEAFANYMTTAILRESKLKESTLYR